MKVLLKPWVLFLLWAVLWAARLKLVPFYFVRALELGYFRPDADSIAIPIMGEALMTCWVSVPFSLVLALFLVRSQPEHRSWAGWCRVRWGWSLVWTGLFGALVFLAIELLIEDVKMGLLFNALADCGWCVLWLGIRAVVISRLYPREDGMGDDPENARRPQVEIKPGWSYSP